jgi:gamma-glutamyl hercynylcysteine S-oxide synthase
MRSPKQQIQQDIIICREHTLSLFQNLDYEAISTQIHPEFSPAGWHLGHIAYTWDYWILGKYAGQKLTEPNYERLFAVDGLPKAERSRLPELADVINYVNLVGDRLLIYSESSSFKANTEEERLWRWLIQHESQHAETATIILQLLNKLPHNCHLKPQISPINFKRDFKPELITIPSGSFIQGNNCINSMDNENSPHSVYVDSFAVSTHPVSQKQYLGFINAGGYDQKQWWSASGWQWLQEQQISKPLHWQILGEDLDDPVCGINWYEASAYARFAGMRLPTESEWEKAASYLANYWGDRNIKIPRNLVWEWTSTLFHPYPNFLPFPYSGYSSIYFNQQHFVLKGGSWASRSYTLRSPFRNWYQPHVRQIFAGVRCVKV